MATQEWCYDFLPEALRRLVKVSGCRASCCLLAAKHYATGCFARNNSFCVCSPGQLRACTRHAKGLHASNCLFHLFFFPHPLLQPMPGRAWQQLQLGAVGEAGWRQGRSDLPGGVRGGRAERADQAAGGRHARLQERGGGRGRPGRSSATRHSQAHWRRAGPEKWCCRHEGGQWLGSVVVCLPCAAAVCGAKWVSYCLVSSGNQRCTPCRAHFIPLPLPLVPQANEPAPLRAPQVQVADAFQAKAAAKRKRQEEARAALAAAAASGQLMAPSPAKKSRVLGDLAPRPCTSPPVAQTAAAAARVVPSGQGSPSSRGAGAPPPSRRKQQHPTAMASDSVADSSSRQRQQQEAAQQREQQAEQQERQAAGRATMRAPSTGRTKQQTLSPTKSGKSRGSGRSTGGKEVPEVLLQADQEPVAPSESGEAFGRQGV